MLLCLAASAHSRSDVLLLLPPLGNSAETDRLLLREVSDEHIYLSDDVGQRIETTASQPDNAEALLEQLESATSRQLSAWQRVQHSRRLTIPEHPSISRYLSDYRQEIMWIEKILNRAGPYIEHIVSELDQRYMPLELALLPAIESGYRSNVVSVKQAAGLWQIVPETAKDIGISRSAWFDGRADIVRSTSAALDYLSYLNAEFHGDWLLSLAAYNGGLGRVKNAIKRNVERQQPADFWSLNLPKETENYVPKLLALVELVRAAADNELTLPETSYRRSFQAVDLEYRVSLDRVAAITKVPEPLLLSLNRGLTHGITPPRGPHTLYLPADQSDEIVQRMAATPLHEWFTLPMTHTVRKGDTLIGIARHYGLPLDRLTALNALDDSTIRIGQELAVRDYRPAAHGNIEYIVMVGDTLSEIAQRFSVDVSDIKSSDGNQLNHDLIHPGVQLTINIDRPNNS